MILLLACSEPEAESAVPIDAGECADAPVVTYNSFGASFMGQACQPCHSSALEERYGAPEDASFDTVEDCWRLADRILARAGGEEPTMPPAGGTTEEQRAKLAWWLGCGEEGS